MAIATTNMSRMSTKAYFILSVLYVGLFQTSVHSFGYVGKHAKRITFQRFTSSSSSSSSDTMVSSSASNMMGIKSLGVDFGLMRTGVAVTMGYAPSPIQIIQNSNQTEIIQEVVKMIVGESASQIVVGLPLHKNGTMSEQANITSTFASQLAYQCHAKFGPHFPVYLFDERYSSKEAEARIKSSTSSPSNRHLNSFQLSGTLDADSACIILEHFYAAKGEGRIRAYPPQEEMGKCEQEYQDLVLEKQKQMEELQKQRESSLTAKQVAMEKVRLLEEQMARDGTLKKKNKKGKKKKQMQSLRSKKSDDDSDGGTGKSKWITL